MEAMRRKHVQYGSDFTVRIFGFDDSDLCLFHDTYPSFHSVLLSFHIVRMERGFCPQSLFD
jgi:hypothetical protein